MQFQSEVLGKQRVKKKEEHKSNELGLRDRIKQREQRMHEWKQQRRNVLSWRQWIKEAKVQVLVGADQLIPDLAFEIVRCLWKQVMLMDDSQILEIVRKPHSLMLEAAKQGNLRFLMIIICSYPDLVYEVDENQHTIYHFAVMYRHLNIFRDICCLGSLKDSIVQNIGKDGNNILHLAVKLPPADRPDNESAALHFQMALEMSWFERVKRILHPVDAEAKNKEGKTARALFTEEHRELRHKAERWVKDIANGCIMGAILIATVVFAAAFTIPGGINDSGTPNLVRRASFTVFAISDTIALLLSIFSILMFLAVISSRYEEADY
ncbi:ankyrin repeat-containing protein ITN1-like [Mangifera indica]|uniref:ankyrin repeat-containing protein ITN1-like n=1 Tax=Mangifera indica TaxID=29780 RepID=UPI001CFAD707|nr:ankyrin repeat-containing protein ITN1-like [Mangifera indica]